MQLSIEHFQKPETNPNDLEVLNPRDIAVLNDECRNRDGDILPPKKLAPFALRGLDLKNVKTRAELICMLTAQIPLNEYNLPKFIYRSDLLDPQLFCEQNNTDIEQGLAQLESHNALAVEAEDRFDMMQQALDAAIVRLDYYEGYPSIDGVALWETLNFESREDFEFFKSYLALPGARQLAMVANSNLKHLTELYHLNYWGVRALAHDIFAVVHYQRMRDQRILKTEDSHFLQAEQLLSALKDRVNEIDWEACKDPKLFVEVFEKLAKIQRAALGQSSMSREEPRSPSLELTLRKVTQSNTTTQRETSQQDALALLDDPEATEMAQELIIRLGQQRG